MKNVLLRLREIKENLSSSEKNVVEYIIKNSEDVVELNIRKLASKTYSSPSTIIRIFKKIDLSGYKEFKKNLIFEIANAKMSHLNQNSELTKSDDLKTIVDKIIIQNIQSLEDTKHLIDEKKLLECINLIDQSSKILLYGIGSSLNVAKDMYLKFLRLDKPCVYNEDYHSQILQAINSTKNDIAIIFSYSGQTEEMLRCIKILKENKTKTIAITRYGNSPISKAVDHNIFIASNETIFRSGAMSSRINQLTIVDIIYSYIAIKKKEHYLEQLIKTHIRKEGQNI